MSETIDAWPLCPQCHRPRHTWCPVCETAGHEFPQGDQFTMEEDEERRARPSLLLICPTCDEPFKPRYLRYCEWCNHDFGTGIDATPAKESKQRSEFNVRVAIVAAGIVGVLAAAMLYVHQVLK